MAGNLRDNRNEMIRLATTVWAGAPAIIGRPGPYPKLLIVASDGDGVPSANDAKNPWCRIKVQHTLSRSTSISGRVYKAAGTLTLSVFVWRDTSDAWSKCELMATAFADAIRDSRGNVNFRDVTVRERPINNGFSQADVVASFWYMSTRS